MKKPQGDALRDWNEITAGKEGRPGRAAATHSSESSADDGKELGFREETSCFQILIL